MDVLEINRRVKCLFGLEPSSGFVELTEVLLVTVSTIANVSNLMPKRV